MDGVRVVRQCSHPQQPNGSVISTTVSVTRHVSASVSCYSKMAGRVYPVAVMIYMYIYQQYRFASELRHQD